MNATESDQLAWCFSASDELNKFFRATIAYDELQAGFSLAESELAVTPHVFGANDCWHLLYVQHSVPYAANAREHQLLAAYFQDIDSIQKQQDSLLLVYRYEKDSLLKVIRQLRYPNEELIDPPAEIERLKEELVTFPTIKAKPPGGEADFIRYVQGKVDDIEVKYSGNITFLLTIERDGSVDCQLLHMLREADQLASELKKIMEAWKWYPAERQGRKIKQEVIVSVTITER